MLYSVNKIIIRLILPVTQLISSIIVPLIIPLMLLSSAQSSLAIDSNKINNQISQMNQINQRNHQSKTQEYQQIAEQIELETLKHKDYAKSLADKIEAQIKENIVADVTDINDTQKPKNSMASSNEPSANIVEQVLTGYGKLKEKSCDGNNNKKEGLLIFVSFSMPENLLNNYDDIARKLGAKLVIRGLKNNSFKETIQILKDLKAQGVIVDIDPVAFKKFNINLVPSFTLSNGDTYDKLVGSVSIIYALEKFASAGDLKIQAQDILRSLKDRNFGNMGGLK